MPTKTVETPFPLIDADPHAARVIRYFRPSDYGTWAVATAAFPSALYLWGMYANSILIPEAHRFPDMADRSKVHLRTALRLGGLLGFVGGFLLAYQRSSCKSYPNFMQSVVLMGIVLSSPVLGMVREQARIGNGFCRTQSTC
jgi:hypothetical protein